MSIFNRKTLVILVLAVMASINGLGVSSSPSPVISISAGYDYTLALRGDGTIWAWGSNVRGQLGDGSELNSDCPIPIDGLTDIETVYAGHCICIARKRDGTVWTWGYRARGTTSISSSTSSIPVQDESLAGLVGFTESLHDVIATKNDGTVWRVWRKYTADGGWQIEQYSPPVQILGLMGIKSVACGFEHSLALGSDGAVWAWGKNNYGQLGDGTTRDRDSPAKIKKLTGVVAIAADASTSLALKSDGTVWAWGEGLHGQMGNGAERLTNKTPAQINGLTGVKVIAIDGSCSGGLKGDGSLWVWGYDSVKTAGESIKWLDSPVPLPMMGLGQTTAISLGIYHNMALDMNGRIWAWGCNCSGELGNAAPDWSIEPIQVQSWGLNGTPDVVKTLMLLRKLGDKDENVRRQAMAGLASIGAPALGPLLQSLGSRVPGVRCLSARALGGLRSPQALERLIAALADPDLGVRKEAARALGELRSEKALEPLILLLAAQGRDVWDVVCEVLGTTDPDWFKSELMIRNAQRFIAMLKDDNQEFRGKVMQLLARMEQPVVEPLIAALKDGNPLVRAGAAETLGKIQDARAIVPLLAALEDGQVAVVKSAVWSLGELHAQKALEPLILLLLKAGGKQAWGIVINALTKINPAWVKTEAAMQNAPGFIACLKDGDREFCAEIIQLLAKMGTPILEPLIAALNDGGELVRAGAAEVLGLIKNTRAVEPLVAKLTDKNEAVRKAVVGALAAIRAKNAVGPLVGLLINRDFALWEDVLKALGQIDAGWGQSADVKRAIPDFIALLKDTEQGIRKKAARLLGAVGDERAVEPLIEVLLENEKAYYAAMALAELGPKAAKAIPVLIDRFPTKSGTSMVKIDASYQFWSAHLYFDDILVPTDKQAADAIEFIAKNKSGMERAMASFMNWLKQNHESYLTYLAKSKIDTEQCPDINYGAAELAVGLCMIFRSQDNDIIVSATMSDIFDLSLPYSIYFGTYALRRITGVDLGYDKSKWQQWWEENKG